MQVTLYDDPGALEARACKLIAHLEGGQVLHDDQITPVLAARRVLAQLHEEPVHEARHLVAELEDLALLLQEQYGVAYKSRTSYTNLLHRCGFSYQKTEKVFKNHSAQKIAEFEEYLEKN